MTKMSRSHGFTLIELLIVVAVVALLVGLMVPALASARKSARSAVCLSNTRQIAEGFHLIADSNKGMLPGVDDEATWDVLVQGQLGAADSLFICPADQDALDASADGFPGLSYGWREWFEVEDDSASLSGWVLSSVTQTDLIMVFEDLPGRHLQQRINAATVDGSARSYTVQTYQTNLARAVK